MIKPQSLHITLAGDQMEVAIDGYRGPMADNLTRLLVNQERCFQTGTRFVGRMPPIE